MSDARPAQDSVSVVTVLDSGTSLDVPVEVAGLLLAEGLIYYCGEPEGICCYVPADEACRFHHIDRAKLEENFGIDFTDDNAGWRFVEARIAEIAGRG